MRIQLTKWNDYETVVEFPVFSNFRVRIVYTDSIPRSHVGRYGSAGNSEGASGLFTATAGQDSHLFLNKWDPGVVAHESFHAVRHMLVDWAGCEMDNENIAYHLTFLVERVNNFKSKVEAIHAKRTSIVKRRNSATRRSASKARKAQARTKNPPRPDTRRTSTPRRRAGNRSRRRRSA